MASAERYSAACIELFTRIWLDLEAVMVSLQSSNSSDHAAPSGDELEILRLELVLLIDACQSVHWKSCLSAIQRFGLQSTVRAVLDDLNAASENVMQEEVMYKAQNRLLDALREHRAVELGAYADASLEYA